MGVVAVGRFRRAIGVAAMVWPAVVVVALVLMQVVPCWYVTPDSAVYVELARNVASGRGYVYNEQPYWGYPPVFPALLALVIRIFGDSVLMMRAVIALAVLGFLGVSFALVRKLAGWRVALFVVLLFGLSFELSVRVRFVLSDPVGALLAVVALLALWRFEQTDHRQGRFGRAAVVATVLTLLAVFTRLANVALLGAVVLRFFVLRRDRFSARTLRTVLPLVGIVLVCVVLWHTARVTSGVSTHRHPVVVLLKDFRDWDSGYLGVAGILARALGNVRVCANLIARILIGPLGGAGGWLRWVPGLLVALGLSVSMVRRRGLVEAFTVCVLVLPLGTPFVGQGPRYYLPVMPLLFFYVWEAVSWLVGLAERRGDVARAVVRSLAAAVLLVPVVLMAAEVGPLGRALESFAFPKIVLFAVAFAASMVVGLVGLGRVSFRRLMLPVAGALLLVVWTNTMLVESLGWIYRLRRVQQGQTMYYQYPHRVAIADELQRRAKPDEVFVASIPSLYRGLTGLRASRLPRTRQDDRVFEVFAQGRWVIVDLSSPVDEKFAVPVLEAHPELFELVAQDDQMQLWRRQDTP